ncbi:MAG: recombinase family protein [Bacilli bacterium]
MVGTVENKVYKVGIYLRLSREDKKEGDNESGSIGNQRDLLLNYIKDNNLIFVDEYIDDGISGTTFDRENFNRMLQDIESKKINMVIVKDSSRLGRNYLESGLYLEQYFPERQIRCVCLNDNYDSLNQNSSASDIMPFKNIMNEFYVKDISNKVKSSVTNRRKSGKFLGTYTPYGYNKDPLDKNKLVIDETSAEVVKRIFKMFASGVALSEIARILTDEKVPIPSVYKNYNRGMMSTMYGNWGLRTISDILQCPTYIGNLTQGRTKKISYKSKKRVRTSRDEWIVVEGACPPIIDKETFDIVQNIYNKNKNQGKNTQDILLKGMVYCKECGHTIGFRLHKAQTKSKGEVTRCYGNCNYWAKHKRYAPCTPHNVKYYELEELVLKEVKKMAKSVKKNNLPNLLKNNDKKVKKEKELETRLSRLKQELSLSTKKVDDLYMDKLNGVIDLDMFKRMYNTLAEDKDKKTHEIKEIETSLFNFKNNIVKNDEQYNKIIDTFLSMKEPNIQLLTSLIDKIVIDEQKNVDIFYKIKPLQNGY